MTGFVLWRARAHRLLLAAALLAMLLTTAVLTTLTAFSGSVGDAGLRHTLRTRDAAAAALVVRAEVPDSREADTAIRKAARATFDGLPVTVRTLPASGPYALPRSLQEPGARGGNPDLTHFAALDASRTLVTGGKPPRATASGAVEVAVPDAAGRNPGLRPGSEFTLADRLGGPRVHVRVTGTYRPVDTTDPYWRLDELAGRGVQKGAFTTYGPLMTARGVLTSGRVSAGSTGWAATADYSTLGTGRIGALRAAATSGPRPLLRESALGGSTDIGTDLPEVLDRVQRALSVARNTLLIVALQLVVLAACALLLVARLLASERAGETRLLRARGGSRRRLAALAAAEALLLALPAVVCAPLLAAPLTRFLVDRGATSGLASDGGASPPGPVWLTAVAVALGCTLAVAAPALTAGTERKTRTRALPAPLRAGADLGLLAVAAVAYWQLRGHASGGDGIDPLLVAAPALALLAGTVLVLRLLPLLVRLGERRAAHGSGLAGALAGWQLSRRSGRGAGPVLLLVLAVAMGMLALGQGASWHRSQDDQADFRTGSDVRVSTPGGSGMGRPGMFATLPGVRDAMPATRSTMPPLTGDRAASVLAVDTASAGRDIPWRGDLSDKPVADLLAPLAAPGKGGARGVPLPRGTRRLDALFTLAGATGAEPAEVTVTLLDRYGIPYRLPLPHLPADARRHRLALDIAAAAASTGNSPAEPLTLTGVDVETPQPGGAADTQRLSVTALRAITNGGTAHPLKPGSGWRGTATAPPGPVADTTDKSRPTPPRLATSADTLTASYGTGFVPEDTVQSGKAPLLTLRLVADTGHITEIPAVATDRFLDSSGAAVGHRLDVPIGTSTVRAHIIGALHALPTTGSSATGTPGDTAGASSAADARAGDGGALLIDLRTLNRMLLQRFDTGVTPDEWWLTTDHGGAAKAAGALRARPDIDPAGVLVRDETAASLRDDPIGAGPEAAFTATTAAAAVLAAVGFAVGAVGSLRERREEFTVLRALGAPRRRLARTVVIEYATLIVLALAVGTALGVLLTRAVVPLVVLTPAATVPVPGVLVELPPVRVAVLLLAVAAAPVVITAFLALRRTAPVTSLRAQGGE